MRSVLVFTTLALAAGISALPQPMRLYNRSDGNTTSTNTTSAPPLPEEFIASAEKFEPVSFAEVLDKVKDLEDSNNLLQTGLTDSGLEAAANCANPRTRTEWDNYSDTDRQAYIDAVRCLMEQPSQTFPGTVNTRYEDLIRTHQIMSSTIHGNAKFLPWHRYFVWSFEDMLRSECGFTANLPWWDETKYAGRFEESSLFTDEWLGSIDVQGRCVTDGQFADVSFKTGGPGRTAYCLSRRLDNSYSINASEFEVNRCNNLTDFAAMEFCSQNRAHVYGHVGIGGVMNQLSSSPSDPVFWMHHAFIDRAYATWQSLDESRKSTIDGKDNQGQDLTTDTEIDISNLRATIKIIDILNTAGETMCYTYDS